MPLDDLSGGMQPWQMEALIQQQAGCGVSSALRRTLQHARILGTLRPRELTEVLWVVRDKEAFRAWAAAVRMGGDPYEAAEQFTCKKEAGRWQSRS